MVEEWNFLEKQFNYKLSTPKQNFLFIYFDFYVVYNVSMCIIRLGVTYIFHPRQGKSIYVQ